MQRDPQRGGHYEWFSGFLDARGAGLTTRVFIGGTALSMAMALVILLIGAGGPQDQPREAMMWLAAGGGVAGAALWFSKWPTRKQSVSFAFVTTASISLACLAYPDPLAALLGCIAFATIGAYFAFFHPTRLLIGFFVVATAVALSQAVEIAMGGRMALAVVDSFLVVQANVAMPLVIHSLLRALKGDLAYADLDPLTGLLNRRAFRRQTLSLIARHSNSRGYLVVALLDLDKFKSVNDTLGHTAGDHALVAVAGALRTSATSTAVIARSGGEEFLIADVVHSLDAADGYQEFCHAVTQLSIPLTASVGTALAALDAVSGSHYDDVVDHLIAAADMSMYRAKRNGGNQCHHHGLWLSPKSTP